MPNPIDNELKYADTIKEHSWLTGKRISHTRYGAGTITQISCNDKGEITILIKFDKPFDGLDERNMGYQFCLDKGLIKLL